MKVIIAGGRSFSDWEFFKAKVYFLLANSSNITIVSGRCSTGTLTFTAEDGTKVFGADGLAERYANEYGYKSDLYPANWKLGKSAGVLRNKEMAQNADALIAFWDGKSSGTKNMIEEAKKNNLKIKVVNY